MPLNGSFASPYCLGRASFNSKINARESFSNGKLQSFDNFFTDMTIGSTRIQ